MAALTSGQHAGILMFLWIIGSVAAGDLVNVKVKPGQDVTLQCNAFTDADITVLEWSRPGLERYVFFFRDNRLYESYQNPRYRGRVELKDPEMKNGDVSILLKNVTVNDTGNYQCQVITLSNNRRTRNVRDKREFVHAIHLTVSEGPEKHLKNGDAIDEQPGGSRGYVGMGASLGLVCLTVGGLVVVGLVVKSKRAKEERPLESVDVKLNP